mmetsp:Transcript_54047/g.105733  ORF Transcript_54047/g.105733 Transcript_54047/m.105733 type:complete len:195 (+) Transcript_54047:175-759(+)
MATHSGGAAGGTGRSSGGSSHSLVSRSAVNFVHQELISFCIASNSWDYEGSLATVEDAAFPLGAKIVERLTLFKPRLPDQKNCVKFVCKDFWNYIFNKNADQLQTNRKGGYVIRDYALSWFQPFSGTVDPERRLPGMQLTASQHAHIHGTFLAGLVRGALTSLGVPCTVVADCTSLPSCVLHVKIPSASGGGGA